MIKIVRPLRSGQITIPSSFRARLGIDQDTLLQISLLHGELRIKPVKPVATVGGSPWLKDLYKLFEPVRQEAKEKALTGEKINDAIDDAVKASRTKHAKSRF